MVAPLAFVGTPVKVAPPEPLFTTPPALLARVVLNVSAPVPVDPSIVPVFVAEFAKVIPAPLVVAIVPPVFAAEPEKFNPPVPLALTVPESFCASVLMVSAVAEPLTTDPFEDALMESDPTVSVPVLKINAEVPLTSAIVPNVPAVFTVRLS